MEPISTLPTTARFEDPNGQATGREAMIEICRSDDETSLVTVGTGFFVGHSIFITATHVMLVGDEIDKTLRFYQALPDDSVVERNLRGLYFSGDAAIGMFEPLLMPTPFGNVQLIGNAKLNLTLRVPAVDEFAASYGFPSTKTDKKGLSELFATSSWHVGYVRELYLGGRDTRFLPNSCFHISVKIPHGTSGGPVADERGRIFGLNSTGFDLVHEDEIGFVSGINTFMDVKLNEFPFREKRSELKPMTLRQLAATGFVACEEIVPVPSEWEFVP